MSQSRRRFPPRLRIPALILCTTFTLTQAAPAWALRPQGAAAGPVKAGLEEAFGRVVAPSSIGIAPNLAHLDPSVALRYAAYQTSRQVPAWRAQFYNRFSSWQGESDCRVCAMRGNVLQGIPQMLHLMLTGGYDGAGITIKAKIKGKYHLETVKDRGHLDGLLQGMFGEIGRRLRALVAREYGVTVDQVRPLNPKLAESFELDPEFGDLVFRMRVGDQVVSIPMEAIGHTRWATIGRAVKVNSHPFQKVIPGITLPDGRPLEVALAHNGNFNTFELFRPKLLELGAVIEGKTDSENLALVVGFMHRGQADGQLVPLAQAVERALRFIKYVEDWRALINLLQQQTLEAKKHHPAVVEFLREELAAWGITVLPKIVEADLITLAKEQVNEIILKGLQSPWVFETPSAADSHRDIAMSLSVQVAPDAQAPDEEKKKERQKAQVAFRQRFFNQTYSSIAIAVMNNVEDGIVVARGRRGGALSVYVPPIFAVSERVRDQVEKITIKDDPAAARTEWLPHVRDVQQQVTGLVSMWQSGTLILPHDAGQHLQGLQRQLAEAYQRVGRLRDQADLADARSRLLAMFKEVQGLAETLNGQHDPGRRIAASEPRAIPGVPGSAREHPEERFRKAGRGQMDGYKLEMGYVALLGPRITMTSVWDSELKTPVAKVLPKPEVVDLANVDKGAADSRLELEIQNMLKGARDTLAQFEQDTMFQDLHYPEDDLKNVEDWIFVGEGTSEHLSRVAALSAEVVPGHNIRVRVLTGKEFQALIASGELRGTAEALAQRGRRMMVTFVSNTGQTETLLNGATQLNIVNQQLSAEQRVLPSIITNVAGSAIDDEVSKFDGDRHAVYTLVGYEMAVPATGSLAVGVMAGGLLMTYVKSLTADKPKTVFSDQLKKLNQFVDHLGEILEPSPDKSLRVTAQYQQFIDDALGRMNLDALMPLIWITGWWVWRIAAAEARLKFQEGFRDPAVSDWDVISGKHGPYGILRPGQTAIAFLPSATAFKEGHEITLQSLRELRSRVGYSEGGGRQGQLVVLMDAADRNNPDIYGKVAAIADVVVPIPDMDNPLTGFIGPTLFLQFLTLYGARERFQPVRQKLLELDHQLQASGVLTEKIVVDGEPEPLIFHNSAEFLAEFSTTLSDPRSVSQSDALEALTELELRDPAHFREFRMRAQQRGQSATELALEVTQGVVRGEIGGRQRGPEWAGILQYAQQAHQILRDAQTRLTNRRQAIHAAMERHRLDPSVLKQQYERLEDYSFAPSEAIRFAGDPRGWREYTETFVRHLSKQISGVEQRFDTATRRALREHGIPDTLLETTLRGLLRLEDGQVSAYPGVLELLSDVTGRSRDDLLRVGLHHEGTEILLRTLSGADMAIREALARQLESRDWQRFREQFADEFQDVDEVQWPYEVAAQYYTARFTGDREKLGGLFGGGVGEAIESAVRSIDPILHSTLVVQPASGNDAMIAEQIGALQRVADTVKQRTGEILRVNVGNDAIPEVEVARAALTVSDMEASAEVAGGLEEAQADREQNVRKSIEDAIGIYGRIVGSKSDLALSDVPTTRQIEAIGRLVTAGKYGEAAAELAPLRTKIANVTPFGDAEAAIVHSLSRVLTILDKKIRELIEGTMPTALIRTLLDQFQQTQTAQFGVFRESGVPVRTTLIALGKDVPGLLDSVVHPVATQHLNIRDAVTQDVGEGIVAAIVMVEASQEQLERVGVMTAIRSGLGLEPSGSGETTDPGSLEIHNEFGTDPALRSEVVSHIQAAYRTFQTTGAPQFEIFEDTTEPQETVLVAIQYDHHGIDRAILDRLDDVGLNNELLKAAKLLRSTPRPVAVTLVRVEMPLEQFSSTHASMIHTITERLAAIAGEESKAWQRRQVDAWLMGRGRGPIERKSFLDLMVRFQVSGAYEQFVPDVPPGASPDQPVSVFAIFPNATSYTEAPGQVEPTVIIQDRVLEYATAKTQPIHLQGKFYAKYHALPDDFGTAFVQLKVTAGDLQNRELAFAAGLREEILKPFIRQSAGLEETAEPAAAEQAAAAMQAAYEEYARLYGILQSRPSPHFQSVPTLSDVETTLIQRGVREQRFSEVRGALLAMLGGPILTVKDVEGPDGETIRAMRHVLLETATALVPLVPTAHAQAWQIHYPQPTQAPRPPSGPTQSVEGGLEEPVTAAPGAVAARAAGTIEPVAGTVTISQIAGVIYGRAEGLAVGIAVRLTQGGQPVTARFVVRNEAEETVLRHALSDLPDPAILRAWQYRSFEDAVAAARQQLTQAGVQVIHEVTRLPIGANVADDFLRGIQRLIAGLKVQGVEAQTAAVAAQRAYDLFA